MKKNERSRFQKKKGKTDIIVNLRKEKMKSCKRKREIICVQFSGREKPLQIVLLPRPTHRVTIHLL